MAKFPKTLYAKKVVDRDATYFDAQHNLDDCAKIGEVISVGVYQLKEIIKVRLKTVIETV